MMKESMAYSSEIFQLFVVRGDPRLALSSEICPPGASEVEAFLTSSIKP